MLSKTRTSEVKNDLESAIKSTLKLHRQLEMPITPKTHLIEDHAFHQFCSFPFPLFYLIEEFVEVNHQIGHRKEETVKRIKSDEVRAKSKAMQGCISNDSGVQSAIKEIHASVARGPYKKRKENPSNETETTPPPPSVRLRPLLTNEASDSSPSLQQANDLEVQQQSWISSAPHYSPHRSTQ
jgi:hypothetical protein